MNVEEFDGKIKSKLDDLSSPTWKKREVWERINQPKKQKPTVFVRWHAVAASLILVSLIGWFIFRESKSQTIDNQAITRKNITTKELAVTSPIIPKQRNSVDLHPPHAPKPDFVGTFPILKIEKISVNIPLIAKTEKPQLIDNEPLTKKIDKGQSVVILNIPEKENQRTTPEKKRTFVGRIFRQIGKFNTEGRIDWDDINVHPHQFLGFLKNSFKNDSITVDTLQKLKK